MKLLHVVGARPNFMKLAPVLLAGRASSGVEQLVVHTGQHYDREMSDRFFDDLAIPRPDENLDVGSGSHAQQTATIMSRFEPVLERAKPDWVVVYGDVNSTMAATLVASKLGVRVAHVEAGLRSRDRAMPEEINRLVTDQLADLLLPPSRDAIANLLAEGIPETRIVFVGNVMVDTLLRLRDQARATGMPQTLGVAGAPFAFVTLHRPSNVDQAETLSELMLGLEDLAGGDAGAVCGPSENAGADRPVRARCRRTVGAAPQSARVPGNHRAGRRGRDGGHGLGRAAGGNHGPGCALPDGTGQHRAAGHGHRRHQPAGPLDPSGAR